MVSPSVVAALVVRIEADSLQTPALATNLTIAVPSSTSLTTQSQAALLGMSLSANDSVTLPIGAIAVAMSFSSPNCSAAEMQFTLDAASGAALGVSAVSWSALPSASLSFTVVSLDLANQVLSGGGVQTVARRWRLVGDTVRLPDRRRCQR